MEEEYLAHYGVLGMKWGVRHSPQKAYSKASKKFSKLADRFDKTFKRAANAQTKARKSRYGTTSIGRAVWEKRQIRSGKKLRKADKAARKASKWLESMQKEFSKQNIVTLDSDLISRGQLITERSRSLTLEGFGNG